MASMGQRIGIYVRYGQWVCDMLCYAMLCYQSAGFASFFLVAFVFFRPFAYGWTYALTGEICYDMIDD